MSIEQLKKKLESEREDESYNYEYKEHRNCYGCCQSSSDYEKAFQAGHEAATNRLLPLLEKAVDEIKYIKRHSKRCNECGAHDIAEDFLSDFMKMTEINKEFGE